MTEQGALARIEQFLYGLAAFMFVGTVAELVMLEHDEGLLQKVPFALCALGLASVVAARFWPTRETQLATVVVAIVTAIGASIGVIEHIEGNLGFAKKHATFWDKVHQALTGNAPPLAPGMLVIAAVLTLAAVFATRALRGRPGSTRVAGAAPAMAD